MVQYAIGGSASDGTVCRRGERKIEKGGTGMKKKKRCTRVGAGALAAVLAVTAAGVSVPALAQQAVRT